MHKLFPCLLALLLCLAACSAESAGPAPLCSCGTPEDRIFSLAAALYNLPDGYHQNEENRRALFWCHEIEDFPEALRAWEAHDRSRFHPDDFAPGVLEELTTLSDSYANNYVDALGIIGPRYSRYGINRDFPVGLEKMLDWADESALACASAESEYLEDGFWQFTAPVTLTEKDGTETTFTIQGAAWFNEEGKFTAVHIPDDGGLSEFLEDQVISPAPEGVKSYSPQDGPTPGPLVTPPPQP